jgi:hypothetical protein
MKVTITIRHISKVVTDVLSGAANADSDVVVGQKSGAVTGVPMGADSRSGRHQSRTGYPLQG